MTIYKLTQYERGMGADMDVEFYYATEELVQQHINEYEDTAGRWQNIPDTDFTMGDDDEMWYRGENLKDDGEFYDMWLHYNRDVGFSITPINVIGL